MYQVKLFQDERLIMESQDYESAEKAVNVMNTIADLLGSRHRDTYEIKANINNYPNAYAVRKQWYSEMGHNYKLTYITLKAL